MNNYSRLKISEMAYSQRRNGQTVKEGLNEAIKRMQLETSKAYENVIVFSMYWESDDSGSLEDCTLFTQTLSELQKEVAKDDGANSPSKPQKVQIYMRGLPDDVRYHTLIKEIGLALDATSESRTLFILHYAGHAIAGSTLMITPSGQRLLNTGPEMDMSRIKDYLMSESSVSVMQDVLLVMDCSSAGIAGRGGQAQGARMELMAAQRNPRLDGQTFTQYWCQAFTKLLKIGKPFTCADIVDHIHSDSDSDSKQRPSTSILRQGTGAITFLHSGLPKSTPGVIIVALTGTDEQLNEVLAKSPLPISILDV